jgi:hypothetical protein
VRFRHTGVGEAKLYIILAGDEESDFERLLGRRQRLRGSARGGSSD